MRDCLVRPCSRSDAMVLHPAVARDGVAVISVLFLTLFGKDGGEGSIVECGDRMRESEGGVLVLIYALTNRANTIVLALLVRAYINKSVVWGTFAL